MWSSNHVGVGQNLACFQQSVNGCIVSNALHIQIGHEDWPNLSEWHGDDVINFIVGDLMILTEKLCNFLDFSGVVLIDGHLDLSSSSSGILPFLKCHTKHVIQLFVSCHGPFITLQRCVLLISCILHKLNRCSLPDVKEIYETYNILFRHSFQEISTTLVCIDFSDTEVW